MARPWKLARPLAIGFLAVALASCGGDDDGPTGLDPAIFELAIVSGQGQSGLVGATLDEPLVVLVRRVEGGAPEEGVRVTWSVTSGSAEPTRTRSVTDDRGHATTRVVLGSTAGSVRVRASVEGLEPAVFGALTALAAPTLESVSPASADPGDTVQVSVANLPAGPPVDVLFDGVAGEIVDQVSGSPAVLDVVVPAPAGVCSPGSQDVQVRVRVDGFTTAGLTLSVSVPANPFQIGQVLVIEGVDDVPCALLPADGGTARYLLVALSAEFEQAGNFSVELGGTDVAIRSSGMTASDNGQTSFHTRLRAVEQRLAERGLPPATPPSGAALFAEPQVGDRRDFWVLSDVEATDFDREDFERITATLRFVGAHTLLYIDDEAPSPGLTDADTDFLGELYDRRLYDADVDFFGEPTDVDGNERVIVLLSPVVNSLTPRGSNGVTVGFFFGLDLFPPDALGCAECRFSNGSELFYGLVPDPDAEFSDTRTREYVRGVLPGVMVHETQHMINFRYKIFENQKLNLETLWLAEAMAHTAEELAGDLIDAGGDPDLADDLYVENFRRAARYLLEPGSFSLTATSGAGSVGERGGWWLFVRWVAEQYGDFIFRELTQAPEDGVANVEARTGEPFFRLFADWAVAMWADDQPIPGLATRYTVPKWQLRSIIRVEDGGDPVYALQPLQRTFSEFRGGSISEFLVGSSPLYLELEAGGDTQDLQLELNAVQAAGLAILRYE